MSPDEPRVLARFTPNRFKLSVIFAGLVMFTVTAALVLLSGTPEQWAEAPAYGRFALWAVLVLCPVYAADMLARIVRRTPMLVATTEGLVFRSLTGFSAPIPWPEIAGFAPVVMGKKAYLAVYLVDPAATLGRLGTWERMVHARSHAEGVANIAFRSIHLGENPARAAEILERIRRERETAT